MPPLVVALSTIWALYWLTYRAWQVFQKPVPELIEKLALDIPPSPDLVLECIQATEIKISWKQPDAQNSTQRHSVYVNDNKVGETKRLETGITIFNLEPDTRYAIRVFAITQSNHQTPSAFIGVHTQPLDESSPSSPRNSFPRIRPFVPAQGNVLPALAPAMSRELSGGQPLGKKASSGRRHSPSSAGDYLGQTDDLTTDGDRSPHSETLEQLAEQLKTIQRETEESDRQLAEEELAHQAQMETDTKERDKLKKEWKEREEQSSELKKQVANLDRQNRNVQNKKNAKEKLLKQKEDERDKHRQDVIRWKKEIEEMRTQRSRPQSETVENEKTTEEKKQEYREQLSELQAETKAIEEENRLKAAELKGLEEERNSLMSGADNEEAQAFDQLEKEKDREWEIKFANLQQRGNNLIQQFHQAQAACQEAEHKLSFYTNRRSSASAGMGGIMPLDLDPARKNSKRRGRHRSSLASNISSPVGGFPITEGGIPSAAGFATSSNISPTFPGGATFFNYNNGMTLPTDGASPSQADVDIFTGGAPMSPRADSLLPSDLLGDEDPAPTSPNNTNYPSMPLGGFSVPIDNLHSHSPDSSSSRPGSIFTSPRDSTHNLHDADRRSVHSISLSFNHMKPAASTERATSRLSSFFSTNRQRGKTMDEDPPMLGSLKSGQSQSFPRNLDGYDPASARRRRGSHTGSSWATNTLSNIWPRSTGANGDSAGSANQMPSSLRRFPTLFQPKSGSLTSLKSELNSSYNQFSPRLEPIDPSGFLRGDPSPSPRPTSTYSAENPLPRPSTDSQSRFGWPINFDKNGQRNSPLGPDWSSPQPWSRNQSRRPSFQYGSTSNLSLSGPQDVSDIIESPDEPRKPLQAPIGTRPKSSQRPATPKLNPTAQPFKFFSGKKGEKEKTKKREAEKTPEITAEDGSPPDSRLSRDSRSITTAESHDPLERIPSGTPSDGNAAQKETLMQKITRKSSSSKFNIPWKDKLSKKGEPSTPGEIDEDEANVSDVQPGKSVESIATTPSENKNKDKDNTSAPRTSLSFRNFTLRKTKKVDATASESSERASETGEDEMTEEE